MNIRISAALIGAAITITGFSSCSNNDDSTSTSGDWQTRSTLDGVSRGFAASFIIGDTAYVGSGITNNNVRLNDLWAFHPSDNSGSGAWEQCDSMPGIGRNFAVGFGANGFGFIGLGYDGTNYLSDFYKYNPGTDTWTTAATFSGKGRYGAVGFGIGTNGYVLGGYTGNDEKDFYKYDAAANSWSQETSYAGNKREFASCFLINNVAYIMGGSNNGSLVDDMWAYDPNSGWTEKRRITNASSESYDDDYSGITRIYGAAFTVGSKGYLSTGNTSTSSSATSSTITTTWEYDPTNDQWGAKSGFEGSSRQGAVGLSVSGRGFLGLGNSGSTYYDNLFEFKPDETLVDGN